MTFTVSRRDDPETYEIMWRPWGETDFMSLTELRAEYIKMVDSGENKLKLAMRDKTGEFWTKWLPIRRERDVMPHPWTDIYHAYDVHRSLLPNEIVIEADEPTFQENAEAARLAGRVAEDMGFKVFYWYSGGKSVHAHAFLDWRSLKRADATTQAAVMRMFKTMSKFCEAFIKWLRMQIITLYGTGARRFDKNLVEGTHLIRAEYSRHHSGRWKTYIADRADEVQLFPPLITTSFQTPPTFRHYELSEMKEPEMLLTQFIADMTAEQERVLIAKKANSLARWLRPDEVSAAITFMLSDEFKTAADGYKRAAFYIANHLLQTEPDSEAAFHKLRDWNERMGGPVREQQLVYAINRSKTYSFSDQTLGGFLEDLGYRFTSGKYERIK